MDPVLTRSPGIRLKASSSASWEPNSDVMKRMTPSLMTSVCFFASGPDWVSEYTANRKDSPRSRGGGVRNR